jgi:gas vesicle protein
MFDKIKDIVSDITGGKDLGDLDLGGIEKYVEGITFPISKQELKTALQNNGVPDKFLGLVDQLPDKVFESSEDAVNSLAAVAGIAGLDQAADKAGAAADAASDAAGKVQDSASDAAGQVQDAAGQVQDAADDAKGKLKNSL